MSNLNRRMILKSLGFVAMAPALAVADSGNSEFDGTMGQATPSGFMTVYVNGQPVSMSAWNSEVSAEQAVKRWNLQFLAFMPIVKRVNGWLVIGAPVGSHWMGIQVKDHGRGSIGWAVVMPLKSSTRSTVAVDVPVWPQEVPVQMRFQSYADGKLTSTWMGSARLGPAALHARLLQAAQQAGYQVDASLDAPKLALPAGQGTFALMMRRQQQEVLATLHAPSSAGAAAGTQMVMHIVEERRHV